MGEDCNWFIKNQLMLISRIISDLDPIVFIVKRLWAFVDELIKNANRLDRMLRDVEFDLIDEFTW